MNPRIEDRHIQEGLRGFLAILPKDMRQDFAFKLAKRFFKDQVIHEIKADTLIFGKEWVDAVKEVFPLKTIHQGQLLGTRTFVLNEKGDMENPSHWDPAYIEYKQVFRKVIKEETGIDSANISRANIIVNPFPQPIMLGNLKDAEYGIAGSDSYFGFPDKLIEKVVFSFIRKIVLSSTMEDVKIRLKKDTSMGQKVYADGTPFEKPFQLIVKTKDKRNEEIFVDRSRMKKRLFDQINTVSNLEKQYKFDPKRASPSDLRQAVIQGGQAAASNIFRINNLGDPIQHGKDYILKDRQSGVSIPDRPSQYMTGIVDNAALSDFLFSGWNLEYPHIDEKIVMRLRGVFNHNASHNFAFQPISKMMISSMEKGKHHFPNDSPEIKGSYGEYIRIARRARCNEYILVSMDQSQCDSQMATHMNLVSCIVGNDSRMRQWAFSDLCTSDGETGYVGSSFLSGLWPTSIGNLVFGAEKLAMIYQLIVYGIERQNLFNDIKDLIDNQFVEDYLLSLNNLLSYIWDIATESTDPACVAFYPIYKGKPTKDRLMCWNNGVTDNLLYRIDSSSRLLYEVYNKVKRDVKKYFAISADNDDVHAKQKAFGIWISKNRIWSAVSDLIVEKSIFREHPVGPAHQILQLYAKGAELPAIWRANLAATRAFLSKRSCSKTERQIEIALIDKMSDYLMALKTTGVKAEDLCEEFSATGKFMYQYLIQEGLKSDYSGVSTAGEFLAKPEIEYQTPQLEVNIKFMKEAMGFIA